MTLARPNSTLCIHHLALLVSDLENADKFYRGILGLKEEKRWFYEDGKTVRSIWLRTGENSRLMLEQATDETNRRTEGRGGWHLLALEIQANESQVWREYLSSKGITIADESDFSLYIDDPEGNKLALSHWPHALEKA